MVIYLMFMENQQYQDVTFQLNLKIQCNPSQNSNELFCGCWHTDS